MREFTGHMYKWENPFSSVQHRWELKCNKGGIHFHVSIHDDDKSDPSCGLEFHSVTGLGAPSHMDCDITGGRCWHDGTSLYASTTVWPMIKEHLFAGDHKTIFKILEEEARSYFKMSEPEAE